jgi:hypothetical protein
MIVMTDKWHIITDNGWQSTASIRIERVNVPGSSGMMSPASTVESARLATESGVVAVPSISSLKHKEGVHQILFTQSRMQIIDPAGVTYPVERTVTQDQIKKLVARLIIKQ